MAAEPFHTLPVSEVYRERGRGREGWILGVRERKRERGRKGGKKEGREVGKTRHGWSH